MIVVHPGQPDVHVLTETVVLSHDARAHRYELSASDALAEIEIPAPRTTH